MENFQLRQGSSRRTNNAFRNLSNNTCRSFISTALGSDSALGSGGQQLRKSRIQNLPNYKKSSLGDNIGFIVVFQTIEIERLSREVELLRVKIKQNERQLFNAQNYEVQIRQLTQKCFHNEQQMALYTQEIEKLNKIAQNLYNQNEVNRQKLQQIIFARQQDNVANRQQIHQLQQEIQRWKNRSQTLQRNKVKEIQQLKLLMEGQRKSIVDRQIKQMSIRTQNQKSALQNQIRKCRDLLNNKNIQTEDLKKKINKLEYKIDSCKQLEEKVLNLEEKLSGVGNDLNRANQLLKNKQQEILNLKRKQASLSGKVNNQAQLEIDCKHLRGVVESRTKDLEAAKARCGSLEEEALRSKEMIHIVNELQDKLTFATNEINRVNGVLKTKLQENEKIKAKFIQRENQLSRLKNLQNQSAQADARFNMIRAENERINSILKTRLEEIDAWKKKYNDLDSLTTRYALLDRDKRTLEQKYNNQLRQGEQLRFLVGKLQTEMNELRKLQKVHGQQINKNAMLVKQIERLNLLIRNHTQDLNSSKLRYSKMEQSLKNYQQKLQYVKDYENRIKLLADENQRLNNLISNKNEDIESLQSSRIQLITKINHYKNYELKISQYETLIRKLQDSLDTIKRQAQNNLQRCRNYQNKIREIQSSANFTHQEKQRLSGLNKNKNNEIEEYKNRCSKLQQECRKKAQLDLVCQELHGQVLVYLRQLQATQHKYKEYEQAYNKEKKQNQQFAKKIALLSRQLESLTKELNSKSNYKSKQIEGLEEKVKSHLQKVKQKDQQIQKLLDRIDRQQRECQKLKNQFNKLVVIVQNNQRETLALNQKVQQYKDYAKRIGILSTQLDRLTSLNRGLEEDNKKMRLKYADNIDFEKRQQGMALTLVLMSAQMQALRGRIDKREMNLDQMRKSILQPLKKI